MFDSCFFDVASKQVAKLDKSIQRRVKAFVEELSKLENPRSRGKALVGNHRGLWRYRMGDYRIICRIEDERLVIIVVEIGHRKKIYESGK